MEFVHNKNVKKMKTKDCFTLRKIQNKSTSAMNLQIWTFLMCRCSHLALYTSIALFTFSSITGFPLRAFTVIPGLPRLIFGKFEAAFLFFLSGI